MAEHLFIRDRHYLVADDKVQIIDDSTGRVMAYRSWEQGLHQMVEAKEGCELSGQKETLARISYQRFFRRYLKLSEMSSTLNEWTAELSSVYGLEVVTIPTHPSTKRACGLARSSICNSRRPRRGGYRECSPLERTRARRTNWNSFGVRL